eukprot:TRINITY_DN63252_c0_g1_i1.p1 TRINITY_DN63252_c0_g1~~TRINITY_DN63252_c0_g1_i1.p1  ORF type:complete len:614 (+),score=125.36 TRINITY_DN63252_c0_g1_i1:107-1948(+)
MWRSGRATLSRAAVLPTEPLLPHSTVCSAAGVPPAGSAASSAALAAACSEAVAFTARQGCSDGNAFRALARMRRWPAAEAAQDVLLDPRMSSVASSASSSGSSRGPFSRPCAATGLPLRVASHRWAYSCGFLAPPPTARSSLPPGGCWGPGGGGGARYGAGGTFYARVRPKEKITLRAIRAEAKLRREGIARYNKRWRSWAQNRVRQYRLPLPVTLTSDPSLMTPQYITACVQKAAALRRHDLDLWRNYSDRIVELREDLLPEQLGYILWGYGKSSYVDRTFYGSLMPTIKERLPDFQSHALMSLMWCMKRIKLRDRQLLSSVSQQAMSNIDTLRPADFIKVANGLSTLGLKDQGVRTALSRIAIGKFEETFAQQFRDAVHPVSIGYLWSDEVIVYLLERFRRVFITARPVHLMRAYEAAVVCRVVHPNVWKSLSREAKSFYVRLSQRHIDGKFREPTPLHWDVSNHLAELGVAHRNKFRWGPFYIDIGLEELEEDERRRCIIVDTPSSFYFGSNQYLPIKRLQHHMLSSLGWDVRRVRYEDWAELGLDADRKKSFLEEVLAGSRPVGEELTDRPEASPEAVRAKLGKLKEVQEQAAEIEREAKEKAKIDFDV